MQIRNAVEKDAVAIHNLHTRSVRKLCSADYPDEVIEAWLRGRSPEGYEGIAKREMYVYEDAGEIIGWSHVRPGMFAALFVDPQHARKGVGRALFEHVLSIARCGNDDPIEFEATLTGVPFYLKCGCSEIRRSSVKKNNVDMVTVKMALPK